MYLLRERCDVALLLSADDKQLHKQCVQTHVKMCCCCGLFGFM